MFGNKRRNGGFSFVELIIATTIIIVVTVGAFKLISSVSSGRTQLYLTTRAKNLIDAELALTRGMTAAFWETMTSPNNLPENRTPPGESKIQLTRLIGPIVSERDNPHFNLRSVRLEAQWTIQAAGGFTPKERVLETWIGPSEAEVPGANIIGVIARYDDPSVGIENVSVSCPGQDTEAVFAYSDPYGVFRLSGARVDANGVELTINGERRRCYFLPGEGINTVQNPNNIISFVRTFLTAPTEPGGILHLSSMTVHPPAIIQGVVRDQTTSQPVPGVVLAIFPSTQVIGNFTQTIGDKYATTNSQGEYRFIDIIPGRYWIHQFGNDQYAAKSWVDDYQWSVYENDFPLASGQVLDMDPAHPVNWAAKKTGVVGHITGVDWNAVSQQYETNLQAAADINISMYYSNASVLINGTNEEVPTWNTHAYRKFRSDIYYWFKQDLDLDWWDWWSGGPQVVRTDANGDFYFASLGPNILNSTHTVQANPPLITQQEIDVQFGTGGQGVRYPFTPIVVFEPQGGGQNFGGGVDRANIRMLATGFGSYQRTLPLSAADDPDIQDFILKRLRIDSSDLTYDAHLLRYSALNYAWGDIQWAWASGGHDPSVNQPGDVGINGYVSTSFNDAVGNSLGAVSLWYDSQNTYGGNRLWSFWNYSGGGISNGRTFSTKYHPWGEPGSNYYNSLIPTPSDADKIQLNFFGLGPVQNGTDKFVIRVAAFDKYAEEFNGRTYIWYRQLPNSEVDIPNLHLQRWKNWGPANRYMMEEDDYSVVDGSTTLTPPLSLSSQRYDVYLSTLTDNYGTPVPGGNLATVPPPVAGPNTNPNSATIYVNPDVAYNWHISYEIRMWPYWDNPNPNAAQWKFYWRDNEWTIGYPAWFNPNADWGNGQPGAGGGYESTIAILKVGEAHFQGHVRDTSGRRLNGEIGPDGSIAPQAQILISASEFPEQTILAKDLANDFDFDFTTRFVPVAGTNVRLVINCPGYQELIEEHETWDQFTLERDYVLLLLGEQPLPMKGDL